MATTIKSTRVVKTYEYEGEHYNIEGDFTTSEKGNVVSVSGNITKSSAKVGTFNAYDYADEGDLKVNVTGVDFNDLVSVVEACNTFVTEIKPIVETEEPQPSENDGEQPTLQE